MPSKICSSAGKTLSTSKSAKTKSKAGTTLANCRWHPAKITKPKPTLKTTPKPTPQPTPKPYTGIRNQIRELVIKNKDKLSRLEDLIKQHQKK